MKSTYSKIQAVFLALMVLIVSNSYAVTSHFCGSVLVEVSYFGEFGSCGMEPAKDSCEKEQTIQKDCCKDVLEIIKPEVLDKTVTFKLDKKTLDVAIFWTYSYIQLYQKTVKKIEVYKDIPPPDIELDVLALYQIFLI
jgi:hypothetical protein